MITLLLASAIAVNLPVASAAPADHAARCAAANAVVAAMLESGTPSAADAADAQWFRQRQADWAARSSSSQADAIARETRTLSQSVIAAGAPDAAQRLLESRLGECEEPGRADARGAADAASGSNAA